MKKKKKKKRKERRKSKLAKEEKRDTKTAMTEASNPGDGILIRVQWIRVSLLTTESSAARHSPQPEGPDQ